jgi:hypothetical protein
MGIQVLRPRFYSHAAIGTEYLQLSLDRLALSLYTADRYILVVQIKRLFEALCALARRGLAQAIPGPNPSVLFRLENR